MSQRRELYLAKLLLKSIQGQIPDSDGDINIWQCYCVISDFYGDIYSKQSSSFDSYLRLFGLRGCLKGVYITKALVIRKLCNYINKYEPLPVTMKEFYRICNNNVNSSGDVYFLFCWRRALDNQNISISDAIGIEELIEIIPLKIPSNYEYIGQWSENKKLIVKYIKSLYPEQTEENQISNIVEENDMSRSNLWKNVFTTMKDSLVQGAEVAVGDSALTQVMALAKKHAGKYWHPALDTEMGQALAPLPIIVLAQVVLEIYGDKIPNLKYAKLVTTIATKGSGFQGSKAAIHKVAPFIVDLVALGKEIAKDLPQETLQALMPGDDTKSAKEELSQNQPQEQTVPVN